MRSLVWKDLVMARWFLVAAIPVYVVQLLALAAVPPAFALLTLFGAGFFAIISVGVEEGQRTEALWASLPVGRDTIVWGRYLTTVLGLTFAIALSWAVGRFLPGLFPAEGAPAPPLPPGAYAAIACVVLVTVALFLPCYFRLGAGPGVQAFMALVVGLLILFSVVGSVVVLASGGAESFQAPTPEQLEAAGQWLERWAGVIAGALTAIAVAAMALSAMLSVQFYRTRDI